MDSSRGNFGPSFRGVCNLYSYQQFGGECVFSSKFEIKGSKDGAYRASAGDSERGLINFLEDDVVEDRLLIELWCCTEYSDGGADIPACSGKENGGDRLGGSADGC